MPFYSSSMLSSSSPVPLLCVLPILLSKLGRALFFLVGAALLLMALTACDGGSGGTGDPGNGDPGRNNMTDGEPGVSDSGGSNMTDGEPGVSDSGGSNMTDGEPGVSDSGGSNMTDGEPGVSDSGGSNMTDGEPGVSDSGGSNMTDGEPGVSDSGGSNMTDGEPRDGDSGGNFPRAVDLTFAPIGGGFRIGNQSDFGDFVSLKITATNGNGSAVEERNINITEFMNDSYNFTGLDDLSDWTFAIMATLINGSQRGVDIVFVWMENRDDHGSGGIRSGVDADGDRRADSVDEDDDNDEVADSSDLCEAGETGWTSNASSDYDGDGCRIVMGIV